MMYNLDTKTFHLVDNSKEGQVDNRTSFVYSQKGKYVTAEYSGGTILSGNIVAIIEGEEMNMLYHCITDTDELKAGKALVKLSLNKDGKIVLDLDWQWLDGAQKKGVSTYVEA